MKKEDVQVGDKVKCGTDYGTVLALDMSVVTKSPENADPDCVSVKWDHDLSDTIWPVHPNNLFLVAHPKNKESLANLFALSKAALTCLEMTSFADVAYTLSSTIMRLNACNDPNLGKSAGAHVMVAQLVLLTNSAIFDEYESKMIEWAVADCKALADVTDEKRKFYHIIRDVEGKIPAIKAFRAATNCSLKCGKDFIDSLDP